MSHEIRTPLNAIIGMADVLTSTKLTAEQQKCVDVFQRNGVGLLSLINDILDLSKVESGKVELEAVALDLRDVIARAMEVIEIRTKAKGLALSKTIAPQVPVHLIGDPNRLRQVLVNLLGNSVKFTDRGGLEVRVEPDPEDTRPGALRFAVSDTGIGIPEDKVGLVFETFTQADSSTTRQYGGTGLGLSISKQLVERMGGRIWAESAVGSGSTFFFTARFGVQEDQSEKEPDRQSHTSTAESEASISGLRILLADDSGDNRFLILSYLKQVMGPIDIAENGEAAARMFRSGRYDVVLMDVEMPVMDGYAATRDIRAFERETGARPTPVLALTAHAFADMAEKSLQAGFTAHLTKPIRKIALLDALARYANSPRSEPQTGQSPAGRIRVIVEKDMEDVVPAYLDKRRKDIETYREALGKGDLDTVRMMGHKLKGTGAGYGFARMTTIGAAIEKAALDGDAAAAAARVAELARYIDSVELEYSK
jgi:CheY-like chemotaxis protein